MPTVDPWQSLEITSIQRQVAELLTAGDQKREETYELSEKASSSSRAKHLQLQRLAPEHAEHLALDAATTQNASASATRNA